MVDATYTGYLARNMEMYYDLNAVPDGARNLTLHPENRDPTGSATTALSADFLRPYPWLRIIRVRGNSATGDYARAAGSGQSPLHPRRPVRCRLHAAAGPRVCGRGSRQPLDFAQPSRRLLLQRARAEQPSARLVVNYSWDLPGGGRGVFNNLAGRLLLDGWQLSGENDFVNGDWADVILTTSDNFDFTGGDGGNGGCLAGSDPCAHVVRPVLVGDPAAGGGNPLSGWFNTSAFAETLGIGRLRQRAAQRRSRSRASSTGTSRSSRTSRLAGSEAFSSAPRPTTF